jgi:hypothetical protein
MKKESNEEPGAGDSCLYAHYSGDRDQEDHCSKSALGKQFPRPYLENTQHKPGLAE